MPNGSEATADSNRLSVGEAAARLGVRAATLRSWGRRYGLIASGSSAGGHRRYTPDDLLRLHRMQALMDTGLGAGPAAAQALAGGTDDDFVPTPTQRPVGVGGRGLAVPGGSPQTRGLARAAARLDSGAMAGIIDDLLAEHGTIATWEDVLRPVLAATGEYWARFGAGIEIEHVLTETTLDALRAHRAAQPPPHPGRRVLLACAPDDAHVLPLQVLAAALAESRVPTQLLGARVPAAALASATARLRPAAVVVWRQLRSDADFVPVPVTRPAVVEVACGPGWRSGVVTNRVHRPATLTDALQLLARIPR